MDTVIDDIPWDTLPVLGEKVKPIFKFEVDEPTTKILFRWSTMHTDPTPYKVFASELLPQEVFIEVEVPNRYIVNSNLGEDNISTETILTPAGYAYVQRVIAAELKQSYDILIGD